MEIIIHLDSKHSLLSQRSEQKSAKLQVSQPSPLQIFEEAGLVGCFEGSPDLSSNYQSLVSDYIDSQNQSKR